MFQKIKGIVGLLALTYTIHAQTGKIAGKIVDGKTGETLPGATVLIEGTTKVLPATSTATTASRGYSRGNIRSLPAILRTIIRSLWTWS